jgi:hypothetical protein
MSDLLQQLQQQQQQQQQEITQGSSIPAGFAVIDLDHFAVASNSTHLFFSYGNTTDSHTFYLQKRDLGIDNK